MKTKCRLKIMQFAMIAAFLFMGLQGVFAQHVDAEMVDPQEYLMRYGRGEEIKPVFFTLRSELGAQEKHLLDTLTQGERNSIEESIQPPAVGVIRDLKQTVNFYLNPADIPMEGDVSVAGGRLTRINKDTLVFTTFFQTLKADEIRVFFAEGNFPHGVQVNIFSDNDYAFTQTELRGRIDEYGFYTTTTFADHLTLQVVIPINQLEEELYFVISRIIHVDNRYLPEEFRSCYLDANCSTANGFANIEGLKRSTARLYFPVGSLYGLCTGNQLNDSRAKDFQPFLLTANHCFSTQASAAGLEARFYYWSTSCNSGVVNPGHIIRNGANLIATNSQTDFTLVLLKQSGANFYLGWNVSSVANNTVLHSTHHPSGTLLKYQRMQNKTSPTFTCTGFSTANYYYTKTTHGQEFPGSSGSAVVDANLIVKGQLYGWCYLLSGADKCDYDTYHNMWGRFDVTYNSNNLQYWLSNGGASVAMATNPASSYGYGNVNVGSSSNLSVTVTNTGTRPSFMNLEAGNATLSGTHASQFSIIGSNFLYLAPGESGIFTVRFTPTSTGTKTATLTIPHNADNITSPRTISLTGTGVSAPNPCADIISLGTGGSGNAKTYSKSGTGVWNVNACGFNTPGQEQVYSFVAPYTGNYSIQVTATNNTWVDYFWKAGTCGSTGWNCISDVYSPNTYGNISMTAGTTYYILLDAESTATATHTFHIFRNPCLNIISLGAGGSANTVTYSRSGYGGWTSNACGYNCYGQEQIYSFVAPYTGNYSIQVTATNNVWVDYFWKSGTCNADNWTCIKDVYSPGVYGSMSLTAGTTYYILADAEGTSLATQSFFIFFNPCLNITPIAGTGLPNIQTYTGGGSGAWHTTTQSVCGYFCPGIENIFSFTPTVTGTYRVEVTEASGYVNYMWKSGACNNENWECIGDINNPGVYGYLNMTEGITYHILLDDENSTPGTHKFFLQTPLLPGTWIGIADSNWHNALNWSNAVVPNASTNVTIPSGTTYMPEVNANASCASIYLKAGANLTLTGVDLTVSELFIVEGTLNMNNFEAILTVGQTFAHMLDFRAGSTASISAGTINCYGWVIPRNGSTFNLTNDVTVYFKGDFGGGPSNFNPTATFGNIVIDKNAGQNTYFDFNATEPLVVTGDFTVLADNIFVLQNHTVEVNGVFTDHSTSEVYIADYIKNHEGISSDPDFEMSDTPGFRGGVLEIDTDFTLNGLLNVADGTVLVHGRFASTSASSILINGGSFISDAPNHSDKGWQYLNGNLTMDDGLFEITHNSTRFGATATTISGGTIRSGGAFYAVTPGVFQPTGGVVEIIGGYPDAMIYCYNGNHFYDLRINRSAEYSSFAASTVIQNDLYVDNGELQLLSSSNLTVAGNVEINSGGKLLVSNQAKLLMGNARSVTVNNGGILEFDGTSFSQPATLSRISAGNYALNVESGGTLAARNTVFEFMNANGVHIKAGAIVDAAKAFTNSTFRNGQSVGRLLTIHNNQTFEVVNADFPANTWGGSYNVYKNVNQGNVTFTGYTGPFSGSAFEFDPNNRIHWTVDAFTLTFSVENIAGDLIPDALITLAGTTYPAGVYVFNDLPPGTYNYSIASDCYTTTTGQVVISGSNVLQEVTLGNVYGDANGDGTVNVSDIVLIVNYFMDEEPEDFCFFNADINGDDVINVQDVVGTVNIFMSGKTMPWLALSSETAYLHLRSDGIWLESDGTLAGIQFELTPVQMNEMQLSAELPDHFMMQRSTDDYLKAIVFSIDNTPFPAGMIKLVSFDAMENLPEWKEAVAANLNAIAVPVELLTEATLTEGLDTESGFIAYPNPTDNVLWVEFVNRSGNPATVSLSNMHAQLVQVQSADKQGRIIMDFKMNDLAPGIYLIRVEMGDEVLLKKIIVK